MSFLFQLIGYIGTFLSIYAYVPQIKHLLKEHCSAGISIKMYIIWIISSICILLYGISITALVITVMQGANLIAITTILVFARKYKKSFCPYHAALQSESIHALKAKSGLGAKE